MISQNKIRLVILFCLIFSFSAIKAQDNSIESLQKAIHHLIDAYGVDYPKGELFLQRLSKIKDASTADYKALQKEALLAHPDIKNHSWLVEVRDQYWGNHGPINTMFQNGDFNTGGGGISSWSSKGGQFDVITFADGKINAKTGLLDASNGILRDADISFDGKKMIFSMRKSKSDDYHLYEMDRDGSNLKQLTFGSMISDVDPIYLPDGKILFSSTRDPKFCQCNRHISLNMFTMEGDGANIEQVSFNNLADFHSSLMPDGQVLYSRWEYVDRHFGPSLGLWTSNPDGTRHALFLGNNSWSPGSIIDARAIPGTNKVICIYGACHDLPWGAMVIVDRSKGLDGKEPVLKIWPKEAIDLLGDVKAGYNYSLDFRADVDRMRSTKTRYEDPYPIHNVKKGTGGGYFFFASKVIGEYRHAYSRIKKGRMGIVLSDVFGNEFVVYEAKDTVRGAFGMIPMTARKKPISLPNMVDYSKDYGSLYVNDVYVGTGEEMKNVKRGDIKYLRIIEAPARRSFDDAHAWNVDAQQRSAMNWNLTNNKRIIGDAPVEKDGSAFFNVPADMFFQIHALDSNKQMVQAMRSGTVVRPGETQGCIGCHENRLSSPLVRNNAPLAMRRAPSDLKPWVTNKKTIDALPFNYLTEVQPVFDNNCISCHSYGKEAELAINLSGDLSYPFNVSYSEIMSKSGPRYTGPEEKLVNFVGDGPPGVLPAYAWGSHKSSLVRILKEGHYDVDLSSDELQRIVAWIDVNAVYYGQYLSYYPSRNPILALEDGGKKLKAIFSQLITEEDLNEVKFVAKINQYILKHGHVINFTRPELSPVLNTIPNEKERSLALQYIQEASALLAEQPREDQTNDNTPLSKMDIHNIQRLNSTRKENALAKDSLMKDAKYYQFGKVISSGN